MNRGHRVGGVSVGAGIESDLSDAVGCPGGDIAHAVVDGHGCNARVEVPGKRNGFTGGNKRLVDREVIEDHYWYAEEFQFVDLMTVVGGGDPVTEPAEGSRRIEVLPISVKTNDLETIGKGRDSAGPLVDRSPGRPVVGSLDGP